LKGASDDKVCVKGTIAAIKPGKLLQFTVFDPNSPDHGQDVPSNYTMVTYELSSENGRTVLNITQGDFTGAHALYCVYLDDNERTLDRLKNSAISAIDLVEGIGAVNMLGVFLREQFPESDCS
jgi:hypothetical protein